MRFRSLQIIKKKTKRLRVITSKKELAEYIQSLRAEGATIGFVPTMGALHQGHIALISHSQQENDYTVCSIFVNPTQFNEVEDFKKYPRNVAVDTEMLEECNCDILFIPDVEEMYGETDEVDPNLEGLDEKLEGEFRPGHFKGVMQIVYLLLKAVAPDRIYMGLKDYQQQLLVGKMITSLGLPVILRPVETDREESGLARSSRNVRLSTYQRNDAAVIYKTLFLAKEALKNGIEISTIISDSEEELEKYDTKLEYFKICDAETLEDLDEYSEKNSTVILIAIWWGDVRLIDNILLLANN